LGHADNSQPNHHKREQGETYRRQNEASHSAECGTGDQRREGTSADEQQRLGHTGCEGSPTTVGVDVGIQDSVGRVVRSRQRLLEDAYHNGQQGASGYQIGSRVRHLPLQIQPWQLLP
jgi:hypothetical protein